MIRSMSWDTFKVWAILTACAGAATFVGCIVMTRIGWFS
jgi:hypothetical protein